MTIRKSAEVIAFPLNRVRGHPLKNAHFKQEAGRIEFASQHASTIAIEEIVERMLERTSRFNMKLAETK